MEQMKKKFNSIVSAYRQTTFIIIGIEVIQ